MLGVQNWDCSEAKRCKGASAAETHRVIMHLTLHSLVVVTRSEIATIIPFPKPTFCEVTSKGGVSHSGACMVIQIHLGFLQLMDYSS